MSRRCRFRWLAAVLAVIVLSGILLIRGESQAQNVNPPTRLQWKPVGETGVPFTTYRASIPGGWLVAVHHKSERQTNYRDGTGVGMGVGTGVTFVPDPDHRWR